MSFWDHLKPATRPSSVTAVELSADQRTLALTWDDGKRTSVSARALRQRCPCAGCVDEWTRERTLDPATIPEELRILQVRPVGNYALAFTFSDNHQTGIYDWPLLRAAS